jgi:broad specificity phosphatase PhoE
MKLLVVRHGQCEANLSGVVAGSRDDSPLTQAGTDEAAQTARRLIGFHGSIVSSPLQRALRTAEIIRDIIAPDVRITVEPLFIERDVGDATGLPLAEYIALEKRHAPIPNADTDQALFDRVQRGLEQLIQLQTDVLLVTHNGTYRVIECVVRGLQPRDYVTIASIANGEVKSFEL